MMGDELPPKRSPDKNQRLFMINSIYHVKYSARNSLDRPKHFQSFAINFNLRPTRFASLESRRIHILEIIMYCGCILQRRWIELKPIIKELTSFWRTSAISRK